MLDTTEQIRCPACGKIMHKIFIPNRKINLDICLDGCGGIFFDNREFAMFDEQAEDIAAIEKAIKAINFKTVDESLQKNCPVCLAKMVKNFSSIKKEVQVDECYNCGGKFLDYNELAKIRAEYQNDQQKAADVISYLYSAVGKELEEAETAAKSITKSHIQKLIEKLF